MSQQFDLKTGISDSLSGQQSFIFVSDSFTLPLFKHIILLAVNPRLETRKVRAKNKEDIFFKVFICFTKIPQFLPKSIPNYC
jgi:hypothetical protein